MHYLPDRTLGNSLEEFIRTEGKSEFINRYPRDISPTPDNRPYFFNYTKWKHLLQSRQYIFEPNAISQGNPLFIFSQLAISTILAEIFIVLPLVFSGKERMNRLYVKRFFLYFMGLGLGFISIEIVLIQKLILFLGHPIYSLTVTIFSMLIFTGIGSLISGR